MTAIAPLSWPAALAATRQPLDDGRIPHPGVCPAEDVSDRAVDSLLAQFTDACERVGGQVHHLSSTAEVVALIRDVRVGGPVPILMSWDAPMLPLAGLHEALVAEGIEVLSSAVRVDTAGHAEDLARLDAATVGVTGAIAVLAETGSIVVMSGAGRPRLASLLPPVHVALVTRAQLVPSLGAWLADRPAFPAESANCVVITGPSRTADIEMTLTRGVHGPRSVHVVFVT